MRFKKSIFLVFSCLILQLSLPGPCSSQTEDSAFDKLLSYDIYLSHGSFGETIIKDVEILGAQEIYGRLFLVIQPHGFNLKNKNGYILFEAITAIVPKHEFRIQREQFRAGNI